MKLSRRIAPCLWFDGQAEEAAEFYTQIFSNSKILSVSRYSEAGQELHGKPVGSVMAVVFELDGQEFMGLNGGPMFKFSEAISFQLFCETQEEVDYFWERLSEGGDPDAQQCGWLKDRFGVSWQVVPTLLQELVQDHESPGTHQAMDAMLGMKKLDIQQLKRAAEGSSQG